MALNIPIGRKMNQMSINYTTTILKKFVTNAFISVFNTQTMHM
jgi:hypothetical protein